MDYASAAPTAPHDTLLACLAEEESALDSLLFKLKEQYLVLSSGEHRWLDRTTAEVNTALERLTTTGQRREKAAAVANTTLGLSPNATLEELSDRIVDEAAGQRLHIRRQSLRNLLDQVRRTSRHNRELLANNLAATGDALAVLGMAPTYDAAGAKGRPTSRLSRVLDTRA